MTKKREVGQKSLKDVRAAWKRAHAAWNTTEKSLARLAAADTVLLRSLRDAGVQWTHQAKAVINTTGRTLNRKRRSAVREFERLTGRHVAARTT